MRRYCFPVVVFALAVMPSCTDFLEEDAPVSFAVDATELSFSTGGNSHSVTVSSGRKWDITSMPEWVSLQSINLGRSPYEWIVSFSAKGNDEFSREGNIIIKAGSNTADISVSQDGRKGRYIAVESVSLSPTELTLAEGDNTTLTYAIAPSNASVNGVSWKSSNTSVATVSQSGRIDAITEGTTLITVTTDDGGKTASCAVMVKAKVIPVTGVSLDKSSLSMQVGDIQTLLATITPSNATDNSVTWSSSNSSVATVSSSGEVVARSIGSTTITVTTNDGGKKASCNVNVMAYSDVVDLGLSVKWATCNLGASKPEEYGDYYAWGEVSPKELSFWSDNYKWFTLMYEEPSSPRKRYYSIKKYILESDYINTMPESYDDDLLLYLYRGGADYPPDNKLTLDSEDDAARTKLGDGWRIPTIEEWEELIAQCEWAQTTRNGIDGYTVSSKINGNSFFIPYAGWISGSSVIDQGSYGDYWSSSRSDNRPFVAKSISFGQSRGIISREGWYRFSGLSIRPVYTK